MKKILYLAVALCVGFAMASCNNDDDKTATLDFEGQQWTALIDTAQYGGDLLYGSGKDTYAWSDAKTGISGGLTRAYGGKHGYSEGGVAISNYIDADIQNHATYFYQLAIPQSNGSKNFAVVYCDATLTLATPHVVRSMDVSPTTYQLGSTKFGDGYAASLAESGNLTITITADNEKTLEIDLARDGSILETWKTFDLSSLGEVKSLTFTMDGSDKSSYGVKHPKYFAIDNVVVEL